MRNTLSKTENGKRKTEIKNLTTEDACPTLGINSAAWAALVESPPSRRVAEAGEELRSQMSGVGSQKPELLSDQCSVFSGKADANQGMADRGRQIAETASNEKVITSPRTRKTRSQGNGAHGVLAPPSTTTRTNGKIDWPEGENELLDAMIRFVRGFRQSQVPAVAAAARRWETRFRFDIQIVKQRRRVRFSFRRGNRGGAEQ